MKRIFTLFLLLSISCTASTLNLKVGVQSNSPPFSMQVSSNNMFSGFEPDLMSEICKRLPANCTYQPIAFEDFFTQVYDKNIDLGIGQISITVHRQENFLFSMPYLLSPGQIITLKKSHIKIINDLQSKTIGFISHSFYKNFLLDQFNNQITTHDYANIFNAFNGLKTGEVDALLLAKVEEDYWISGNGSSSQFRIIGSPVYLGYGYGIMTNQQQNKLINRINQILKEMENDGSYLKIYNLYFGGIKEL